MYTIEDRIFDNACTCYFGTVAAAVAVVIMIVAKVLGLNCLRVVLGGEGVGRSDHEVVVALPAACIDFAATVALGDRRSGDDLEGHFKGVSGVDLLAAAVELTLPLEGRIRPPGAGAVEFWI